MADGAARAARRNNKAPGQSARCEFEPRSETSSKCNQKLWDAAAAARRLSPEVEHCAHACSGQHTSRYDSSLGLLTKKFCKLVEDADDGVLDLNKAAEALSVSIPTGYQKAARWQQPALTHGVGTVASSSCAIGAVGVATGSGL